MIASDIWKQLVITLRENQGLSYMKQVFEGRRYDLEPETLPCIMLEPTQNGEPERRMNNVDYQYFNLDIYAISTNNFKEFPKTIVGDTEYKGIVDIENDIRACLKGSNTLGGIVTDINIDTTLFDLEEAEKPMVRGLLMPIRILYRQQDGY